VVLEHTKQTQDLAFASHVRQIQIQVPVAHRVNVTQDTQESQESLIASRALKEPTKMYQAQPTACHVTPTKFLLLINYRVNATLAAREARVMLVQQESTSQL